MFPIRVPRFPAAGTVGCKITNLVKQDVLVDFTAYRDHAHSAYRYVYSDASLFSFLFNKT